MDSEAQSASSCLWNRTSHNPSCNTRHHKPGQVIKTAKDTDAQQIPPDCCLKPPLHEESVLKLDPHNIAKNEDCLSCDISFDSSLASISKIPGPKLLKANNSEEDLKTSATNHNNSKTEDVLERLNELQVQDSADCRRKSSLPDVCVDHNDVNVVKSCSSDEFMDSMRTDRNLENSRRNRVPRIKYNTSKDSCTVASNNERPIYPSLPYSPICSPSSSPNLQRCEGQKETRRIPAECSSYTQLHQYKVLSEIGRGSYGVVKLAFSEEDRNYYAMKILSKKKLMRRAGLYSRMPPRRDGQKQQRPTPLEQISREIAILKKLNHENIVKLFEVLNESDGDNLYMVFELVEHGPVIQLPTKCPLSEETAWQYFRDIVMGIEYLHFQKIIHRDIKPSNLLLSNQKRIQISDFGVCNQFEGVDAFLSDTSGTPAFVAPEALRGTRTKYSGKALDIWQMGVSLYSFVYGQVPYDDPNILALYTKITSDPLHFPPVPYISEGLKKLLEHMLEKDPNLRMKLKDIKDSPWVTKNGSRPLPLEEMNCTFVEVTEEDINNCMRPVPKLNTLVLIKSMLKKHSFSHPFKENPDFSKQLTYTVRGGHKKVLRKITTCPSVATYKLCEDEKKGSEET